MVCFSDSTRSITVFAPPVAGLTGSPVTVCEPGTVNFADASTYSGSGAFTGSYWDFGNGQMVSNTNNNAVSNLYPVYGTYQVKHVVKVSALCISDTAVKTIKVYAKPRVSFHLPDWLFTGIKHCTVYQYYYRSGWSDLIVQLEFW